MGGGWWAAPKQSLAMAGRSGLETSEGWKRVRMGAALRSLCELLEA